MEMVCISVAGVSSWSRCCVWRRRGNGLLQDLKKSTVNHPQQFKLTVVWIVSCLLPPWPVIQRLFALVLHCFLTQAVSNSAKNASRHTILEYLGPFSFSVFSDVFLSILSLSLLLDGSLPSSMALLVAPCLSIPCRQPHKNSVISNAGCLGPHLSRHTESLSSWSLHSDTETEHTKRCLPHTSAQ